MGMRKVWGYLPLERLGKWLRRRDGILHVVIGNVTFSLSLKREGGRWMMGTRQPYWLWRALSPFSIPKWKQGALIAFLRLLLCRGKETRGDSPNCAIETTLCFCCFPFYLHHASIFIWIYWNGSGRLWARAGAGDTLARIQGSDLFVCSDFHVVTWCYGARARTPI